MTGSGRVLKGFNHPDSTELIDNLMHQVWRLLWFCIAQSLLHLVHQFAGGSRAALQYSQHKRARRT